MFKYDTIIYWKEHNLEIKMVLHREHDEHLYGEHHYENPDELMHKKQVRKQIEKRLESQRLKEEMEFFDGELDGDFDWDYFDKS